MTGAKIPFRGRTSSLTVRRHDGERAEIRYKGGFLVDLPSRVPADAAAAVTAMEIRIWLKQRARRDVHEIALAYGKKSD